VPAGSVPPGGEPPVGLEPAAYRLGDRDRASRRPLESTELVLLGGSVHPVLLRRPPVALAYCTPTCTWEPPRCRRFCVMPSIVSKSGNLQLAVCHGTVQLHKERQTVPPWAEVRLVRGHRRRSGGGADRGRAPAPARGGATARVGRRLGWGTGSGGGAGSGGGTGSGGGSGSGGGTGSGGHDPDRCSCCSPGVRSFIAPCVSWLRRSPRQRLLAATSCLSPPRMAAQSSRRGLGIQCGPRLVISPGCGATPRYAMALSKSRTPWCVVSSLEGWRARERPRPKAWLMVSASWRAVRRSASDWSARLDCTPGLASSTLRCHTRCATSDSVRWVDRVDLA
jgi:hypothetical protein